MEIHYRLISRKPSSCIQPLLLRNYPTPIRMHYMRRACENFRSVLLRIKPAESKIWCMTSLYTENLLKVSFKLILKLADGLITTAIFLYTLWHESLWYGKVNGIKRFMMSQRVMFRRMMAVLELHLSINQCPRVSTFFFKDCLEMVLFAFNPEALGAFSPCTLQQFLPYHILLSSPS